MKKRFQFYWLSLFMGLCFLSVPVLAQLNDARGTTASTAVQFLAEQGIIEGYSDGTFKPDQEINRAEFLKIVLESADISGNECEELSYSDVDPSAWYYDIVCDATAENIVEGYPDGTFRPAENINLAEASKIVAKVNELDTEVTDSTEAWYQQFIRALQENKVVANTLQEVTQRVSRGEMAQMVWGLTTGNEVNEDKVAETLPQIASCSALGTEIERFQKRQGSGRNVMMDFVDMPMMEMEMDAVSSQEAGAPQAMVRAEASGASNLNKTEGAERYSETNVQEFGVDEADIIKNDGQYIYMIKGATIRIVEAFPPSEMKQVASITVEEKGFYPSEMYVDGNTLTVIGQSNQYYSFETEGPIPAEVDGGNGSGVEPLPDFMEGDEVEIEDRIEQGRLINGSAKVALMIMPGRPYFPGNNKQMTTLVAYDITDRSAPKVKRTVSLEGSYQSSRKVDETVYLVSNKYNDWYWGRPVPMLRDTDLPTMSDSADSSAKLIAPCQDIYYYPNFETANYLTVAAIDTENTKKKVGRIMMLGSGDNVYSSAENLYVTRTRYQDRFITTQDFDGWRSEPTTHIYKFALDGNDIEFTAKGRVRGRVLNQFSMSEAGQYFRIATQTDGKDGSMMTILNDELVQTGQVMGIAPGENIKSVRFMGDKAYMITFENVDPLFVIDLAPTNPKALGELKIPGWSDYLHPYDDKHLIGIGREVKLGAEEDGRLTSDELLGLKIAMFDVSDLENPKEIFKKVVGDNGTNSEATYNHKAFLWDAEENIMALPITVMQKREGGNAYDQDMVFQGAFIYDVDLIEGFKLRGKASHYDDEYFTTKNKQRRWGNYEYNVQRILYIGDYWFTVAQNVIAAHTWDDVEKVKQIELDQKACTEIYDEYSCTQNTQCKTIWREWNECYTDEDDFSKICEDQQEFSRCEKR